MPAPRSSRRGHRLPGRSRQRRAFRLGVLVLSLFLVLVGAMIAAYVWLSGSSTALDSATLCPTDQAVKPPKVIVLLFDQTDRLTDRHRTALRSRFRRILYDEFEREEAKTQATFSRIYIYSFHALSAAGDLAMTERLSLCNPGDADELTKFTENPERVRRTFEERFLGKIDAELAELLRFKESPQSPIIEAIRKISLEVFEDPRFDGSKKRLILVSNMIHNTPGLQMYRGAPDFDAYRGSAYGLSTQPKLGGVDVTLLVLLSENPALQGARTMNFWASLFKEAGAGALDASRIR